MNSFLSVTAGTEVPAKFLEIHYTHPDVKDTERPVGLVGKGSVYPSLRVQRLARARRGLTLHFPLPPFRLPASPSILEESPSSPEPV